MEAASRISHGILSHRLRGCEWVSYLIRGVHMAKMYVSILKFNTQAEQSRSLTHRKKLIEDALAETEQFIIARMRISDNAREVWCIFVAPEYMFANPLLHGNHGVGDVRHLSEGTKVSIESWLETLSLKYKRFLIFPGSIAWKKPLVRNFKDYKESKAARLKSSTLTQHQVQEKFDAKVSTRQNKAIAAVVLNGLEYHGHADTAVSGDLLNIDGTVAHAAPTSGQKLVELGAAGPATKMARNTCLVYLNGKKLLKYNKAQDFHEVLDGAGDTVYIPGQTKAHFTADKLIYGLELCLDHIYESLKLKLGAASVVPQITVLMSAQVNLIPAYLPNPAAMAIHACSLSAQNVVGRGGIHLADAVLEQDSAKYAVYSFDLS